MTPKQLPRFQQPSAKSTAGKIVFLIQRVFPLWVELLLAEMGFAHKAFSRLRDGMISHRIRAVYFPIPKSACTLFATFMALNSDVNPQFNPETEGIHSFRHKNNSLHLDDFSVLTNERYFRFTVIREPYARLVSAYVDKMVKPIRDGKASGTYERCGKFSFEDLVRTICELSDADLEKHFRPQFTFFRNVPMDHVGVFERLDLTFEVLRERFGTDVEGDVAKKVRAPKRTGYSSKNTQEYVGAMSAAELANIEKIPPVDAFYNETLRNLVAGRFIEDFELHKLARERLGLR